MKVFQSLQKFILMIGIQPPEPAQKSLYNLRTMVVFIFLAKYVILTMAALLIDAKSLNEHAESLYAILNGLSALLNLLVVIFKMENFFGLINNFESMIEKREFNCIRFEYLERNSCLLNAIIRYFVPAQVWRIQQWREPTSDRMKNSKNGRRLSIFCAWKWLYQWVWYRI